MKDFNFNDVYENEYDNSVGNFLLEHIWGPEKVHLYTCILKSMYFMTANMHQNIFQ